MLIFVLSIPAISKADPKDDIIAACDSALRSCDKALVDLRLVTDKQKEMIEHQAKELDRVKSQRDSFLHNDTLWFVLGAVTIGFVGNAFSK